MDSCIPPQLSKQKRIDANKQGDKPRTANGKLSKLINCFYIESSR